MGSVVGLLATICAAFIVGLVLAWPLWLVATRSRLYTPLLFAAVVALIVVPRIRRRGGQSGPKHLR